MGNIFTEMDEMLGKLRRNEEQMTEAQKKQYAVQLLALKKKISKSATEICRSFLLCGIRILKEDENNEAIERINMILAEEIAWGALKEASRILFSTYNVDKFLEALCPVHDRVFYEGYAPYWIEHCDVYNEEGKQTHGGGEFSAWNHIIDMGWIEEYGVWKKKDEMCWMIMLPPTMELIQKEYEEAKKRYAGAL